MTVSLKPRRFHGEQLNIPALSGQPGALTALFRACFVTGFNPVNIVSLTRTANVVTVITDAPHGLVPFDSALIANADQADYNGSHEVTGVASSVQFTYAIASTPVTPATGAMTCKIAPAGWIEAYSATSKLVLQHPAGSNGDFLRIDDNNVDGGKSALVRGYRAMTDVDTGTDPFPTTAQVANHYLRKSSSSDATARNFELVVHRGMFYFAPCWHASYPAVAELYGWGQGASWVASDASLTISGFATGAVGGNGAPYNGTGFASWRRRADGGPGWYAASDHTNISAPAALYWQSGFTGLPDGNSDSPSQGVNLLHDVQLTTVATPRQVRGQLPGLYYPAYAVPGPSPNTIRDNYGGAPGRRFLHVCVGGSSTRNVVVIDLDGPWGN